ncbi:LysR substrate-binding domain-containing protein [Brachybacterium sp. NBEC-018]|uniref:LysR substrate-binding domain-containing protein n=1 Tax=Brachybacterium TaxID=43668 RepID=UPI0010CD163B|nr:MULTISPECIES: LysR substrate-binding domain-containing protein [Brachybacterium]MCW1803985.1 LysR substrate-binding domain-containing protein [Brachybacterium squillarum]QCR54275.1 LysR family transcriptional regulator [Brachybacterium sp. SGAir0954]UVY83195.1 LysR substrate-binding domain-containing protein [Brachybacterium sp. NBEC-018]
MTRPVLRVGFVPGVEPDRFVRRWRTGRRAAYLEVVPVPLSGQRRALAEGEVDMCFVRLPLDAAEDLHVVALWEERPAIVVGDENVLSLHEEISLADLEGETEIPAAHEDDAADRVAVVATGVGFTRLPLSLARLHHRKDTRQIPLVDAEPTRIALVWPRAADDELRQEFVGVVRGRTSRSSR